MQRWLAMSTRWLHVALGAGLCAAIGLSGCGDDREVGAACEMHADCLERCVEGKDFPGGLCTVACDDDRDCPGGTACVDKKDGICVPACERDRDCQGGYKCKSVGRRGDSGRADVCLGA